MINKELNIIRDTIALGFSVLKDTMPLYSKKIKTKNNSIIRGKWQKK